MGDTSPDALGASILTNLKHAMRDADLDVLLASSPENILYVAGTVPPSLRTVRSRLACAVLPAEGSTELIVVALERGTVEEACRLDEVTTYREFDDDPVSAFAASLRDRGLEDAAVGIEATYLPVAAFERLRAELPHTKLVPTDDLLAEVRSIKTPEEIETIAAIGSAAQRIGEEATRLVSAGDTENELAGVITKRYEGIGGRLTMLVVGSGPRSAIANAAPTEKALERGDTVRIDVIGTRDNYCSDVARTAVVGDPSEEQASLYRRLKEAHERILDSLRPGVLTDKLYAIYRDAMEAAGLPYYHFVGHGLGITLHEDPFVREGLSVALAPNMVLCIEPLVLVDGSHGMQIEDEVLITSDGCRLLTEAGDLLRIDA